eukprot:COSAG06_NODE_11327_length_1528_cov_1.147656_2_plen_168_part_01
MGVKSGDSAIMSSASAPNNFGVRAKDERVALLLLLVHGALLALGQPVGGGLSGEEMEPDFEQWGPSGDGFGCATYSSADTADGQGESSCAPSPTAARLGPHRRVGEGEFRSPARPLALTELLERAAASPGRAADEAEMSPALYGMLHRHSPPVSSPRPRFTSQPEFGD